MDYQVYPLATTNVDWTTFIRVCQSTLGYSPTRGLDESSMNIDDGCAYLASLNMDNKPIQTLREGRNSKIFEHISFSFIVVTDSEILLDIVNSSWLSVFSKKGIKDYVLILSGSMKQWYNSIITGCSPFGQYGTRCIMNKCLIYFDKAGFKDVWYKFKREKLNDGTFILKS